MNNNFNKRLLAIAIPAILAATNVNATDLNLSQTEAKLAGQTIGATQFIIKYKNNLAIMSEQTASSAISNNKKVQSFVKGFKSLKADKTQYVRPMAVQNHHVVRVNKKMTTIETQAYMQEMLASGQVEFIEIDQMLKPFATPNDPQYSSQWHYFESNGGLNLPAAWDNATGTGVTVAVLDTGYRPHADLNANILPGYDMISDVSVANDGGGRDSDARDTGDAVTANECGYTHNASDSSWHGTHVAGTIAAVTNNGEGVAGVAYNSKVVPVRVLGKCGGLTSDIADGIIWASGGSVSGLPTNANPADVINMSLGGKGACSSTTQTAINTARANGTVIVIAAGNDNDNSNNYNPGNCSGIVNVAAVGRNGGRAYYSNYGTSIDVAAPGGAQSFANDSEGVLSTHNSGSNGPASDSYHYSQGTSMAAPHVAGVAALIKQAKPNATPDEIESILKTTTRSFPATCSNCGTGIVDAQAAVLKAKGTTSGGINVTKTNLRASKGQWVDITINVPVNTASFTVNTSGGTGDMDLYIKAGSYATETSYQCKSTTPTSTETCTISNPTAGTWYLSLYAYSTFSGVSLTAK